MDDTPDTRMQPRRPLRHLRRRATTQIVRAALQLCPRLSSGTLDVLERATSAILPQLGRAVLARLVRRNMQAAGVHRAGAEHAYLRQASDHLASALHFFRHGARRNCSDPTDAAPEVLELARRRIDLDDTIEHLHRAAGENRGVILAPCHATQFLLGLARINEAAPLTVYLRYSRSAAGREAKAAWHRAAGLRIIAEPSKITDPSARAALLAEALADRKIVVITPDVVQRRGKGVPVNLFGREVHLASGVAALSVLTGAPIVAVTSRPVGRHVCVVLHEPFHAPEIPHRRGWRTEAMRQVQQRWADLFAEFLRQHPQLWYFWADNRWTRVFRDDAKYTRRLDGRDVAVPRTEH